MAMVGAMGLLWLMPWDGHGIAMVAAIVASNPNPNGCCYGCSHGIAMGWLWLVPWDCYG